LVALIYYILVCRLEYIGISKLYKLCIRYKL